jgi:hypothetical protein
VADDLGREAMATVQDGVAGHRPILPICHTAELVNPLMSAPIRASSAAPAAALFGIGPVYTLGLRTTLRQSSCLSRNMR